MLNNMFKIHSNVLLLSVVLLGGCASAPPEVTASINLISTPSISSFTQQVPLNVAQQLSKQPPGAEFDYKDITVTLGRLYISALGHTCRELSLASANTKGSADNQQQRIACQNVDKMWIMIPSVVESTNKPLEFTG